MYYTIDLIWLLAMATPLTIIASQQQQQQQRQRGYSRSDSDSSTIQASDTEIRQLISDLRRLDVDRISNIRPNFQNHVSSNERQDRSPAPLFATIGSNAFAPVYARLRALYDNFQAQTGVRERPRTAAQNAEVDAFLDSVISSNLGQRAQTFLASKGYPSTMQGAFKQALRSLWFDTYSRARGEADTSAFEHVFIGELKNGEVQGMHNWYRFYVLEQAGALNYTGFIIRRTNLAVLQYVWSGAWKPTGSFFIGTSPEFDFVVYTVCFLAKPGVKNCAFEIDGERFAVTSYPLQQQGKTYIGSVFPSTA